MKLSKEQNIVMNGIIDWQSKGNDQWLTVSGNAGTGKTFMLSHLPNFLPSTTRVTYISYTGKATSVLYKKLKEANIYNVTVSTIHKLLYSPLIERDKDGCEYIDGWIKNETIPFDLIVIDEASMVGEEIFKDLLGFDIPILAVGDDGQLPPVSNDGFSLMNNPDY